MLWDQVAGHSAAKLSLQKAVETGRVNHAYLFSGPSAVGKFMVARTLAAAVLCPRGGCGECNVCRRVIQEVHPDVTVIRPAGKNIPVETIRKMRMDAYRKPSESERRIFIVKSAERMWEEGASTLLKVLEEPPANVVFVLVTANRQALLPTIRSRCQELRFSRVPLEELKDYIVEKKGVDPQDASLIVRLTGGVLGRALDWCDEPWRLERRDRVVRAARALRRADLNQTMEMAGGLVKEIESPLDELVSSYRDRKDELSDGRIDDSTLRRLSKDLDTACKQERIKEELKGIKEVLSILSWWYRDILVMGECQDPALIVNTDLEEEILAESRSLAPSRLLEAIDLLKESTSAAERNVPLELNMESTLFGLQETLYA